MAPAFSHVFAAGLIAMGLALVGAFFLRFWRRTGDRLFLTFSAAFALLAISEGAAAYLNAEREDPAPIYLLRLGAFGLILSAIVAKNFAPRKRVEGRVGDGAEDGGLNRRRGRSLKGRTG